MFRRETMIALRARRQALSIARAVMYGPPLTVDPPPVPETATPAPPPTFDSDDPPPLFERRVDQVALVFALIVAITGCSVLVLTLMTQ